MPVPNLMSATRKLVLVAGFLAITGSSVLAQEATPKKVLATVNGVEITERELALAEADLAQQYASAPAGQRRALILNALIDIKLLAAEAEKAGMDKEQNFQARMAFLRSRALHNSFFQENALNTITDEELQVRYDKEIAAIPQSEEIRARHILVEKEEEAIDIIKQLDDGADFAELAKEKSTGPSGPNGGDLGYFGKGQMVPEFELAAFSLENGQHTAKPVKTQFGWHVIKKEDARSTQPPAFEQVKDQIRQILAREKYLALTSSARKDQQIDILDEDLKKQVDAIEQAN